MERGVGLLSFRGGPRGTGCWTALGDMTGPWASVSCLWIVAIQKSESLLVWAMGSSDLVSRHLLRGPALACPGSSVPRSSGREKADTSALVPRGGWAFVWVSTWGLSGDRSSLLTREANDPPSLSIARPVPPGALSGPVGCCLCPQGVDREGVLVRCWSGPDR